jgi:hypothetical protein
MAWIIRGSVVPAGIPGVANDGPPATLKRWSISELNEDSEDRRLTGEDAPLRPSLRRCARGVVPFAFGVKPELLVLSEGVEGFL